MKIVLISTYELGRQPFGVVSPAAWLRGRGHEVVCFDLTRQSLDESAIRAAGLIAVYLPMHTATRLAARLLPTLREQNPEAHLCCYGLYAPMNAEYLRSLGVGTILGGEFEGGLVRLAERLSDEGGVADKQQTFPQGLKPRTEAVFTSDLKVRPPGYAKNISGEGESGSLAANVARLTPGGASLVPYKEFGPDDLVLGATQMEPEISLERLAFEVPDRTGMPALEKYAHLVMPGGGYRLVGSTEASRGCKHLCRHCPIVPVYKGVFRIVGRDVVLGDVRQQVAAGARHISFGDPDFFNGIRHAMEIAEEFHREFPGVTYDVTIKIEHLRKYAERLPRLRETGCLFVISAVESVDDAILERLDKGHTREDFLWVAREFRSLGMTLHPTFVPFTPWTTAEGYLDLLRVLRDEELVENVAPVQLGIRLLIPEGSRLLELEEVRGAVGPFDAASLVYPWKNDDARMDTLSETVQVLAAEADRGKETRSLGFGRIWYAAHEAAGISVRPLEIEGGGAVPFLSEPWYCCAEPTKDQLVSIGAMAKKVSEPAAAADGFV
jgi:radical SAM superfamily enzyme YgiQ (UPF0313 family)